jgi:hypothetical protein
MTRLTRNTRDCFELTHKGRYSPGSPDRVECHLEDDDGTLRAFVNDVELTHQQVGQMAAWLTAAHCRLVGLPEPENKP